jgi:phosphomannomutase
VTQTTLQSTQSKDVKFGTSGVRGLVSDLTDEVVYGFAYAFLTAVVDKPSTVVLGHDLRDSSPSIASACAKAAEDLGVDVDYVGALPTPAIAYYAGVSGFPAIVVTGSHIPFDRNGIKFYTASGEITKADEQAINNAPVELTSSLSAVLPPANAAAYETYCQRYLACYAGCLEGRTVAIYQHSSVGRDLFADLFQRLGASILALGRTDQFVPIDTEAVSREDHERATAWASEYDFDVLFSTDGDADRPLIGDAKGQWLRGDRLGVLCAKALGADAVVTPVSSNSVVSECGAFDRVERTKIGSPYVIEGMQALTSGYQSVVGYEANGGFLTASAIKIDGKDLAPLATRDAVLPLLAVMRECREKACSVADLDAQLPAIFTASDRVKGVVPQRGQAFIDLMARLPFELAETLSLGELIATDLTDGCRLTFEDNVIVHFRQSGNAPELRCYSEARSVERAAEVNAQALAFAVGQL